MKRIAKFGLSLIAGITLAVSVTVNAADYDYAKVVSVTPIVKIVRVSTPEKECWTERVVHYNRADDNVGGMILGGIIGGALGNRIGKGNGRKAAIAAGTLIGASIGRSHNRSAGHSYSTNEQRCKVVNVYHEEERIDGYRVNYKYKGHVYNTRTRREPGNRIKVKVSVTPVL